eukprot:GILI01023362.1.p1 GENE.GILI01023362.1~~GILI01023362.1.p1  ORF type:complete len:218 (+),score=45.23 GILI01023362.1:86-655(+)
MVPGAGPARWQQRPMMPVPQARVQPMPGFVVPGGYVNNNAQGGRGRGGRNQNVQAGAPNQGVPNQGRRNRNQNISWNSNVKNKDQLNAQQNRAAPAAAAAAAPAMMMGQEPLTLEKLAASPVDVQKRLLGERLYPLIEQRLGSPEHAGKITGMLLEMDNAELINLLETPEALAEKVNEALRVLQEHASA